MTVKPGISTYLLLLTGLAVAGFYFLISDSGVANFSKTGTDCSEPLTLFAGNIDNRYNISHEQLAEIMEEVAQLWSEAAGTDVFLVSDEGDIAVNLIYSEEQARSTMERQMNDRIESKRIEISILEREYQQNQQRYNRELYEYNSDVRSLQSDVGLLQDQVRRGNERGGFQEEQVQQLEEEQRRLDNRTRELDLRRITLNTRAGQLKSELDHLNDRISAKNQAIAEYNRMFSGTRRFTQGSYEWQGSVRRINVFHFNGFRELKLVLAHEAGHALGIDHVENPASIMYHLMGNQDIVNLQLSAEDRQALRQVCNREYANQQ